MINLERNRIDISIRNVYYKSESMVLPHYRRDNRHSNGLAFYIKGGHRHTMDNGDVFVSSHYDLLYIPYNSNYVNCVTDKNIEYYQIDFELYENGAPISLFDNPRIIHAPESSAFLPYLLEVYNLYTVRPYGYKLKALSHIVTIISMLVQEQDDNYAKASARKRIRLALELIDANYYKSTDIKELATLSGLSVSGLEKNFIKAVGMTPISYRNRIRIEHAKTLLLGGFSISEVCEKVGFTDLYYFAKTFKKITGIPPGKFIKERMNHKDPIGL